MKRILRKPVAFILTLSLIFGMFVVPGYADSLYDEASIINGVDTGFEKQSQIAEVKSQSYDGARTLNSDSHSGRFSLKLGKSGLAESVFCSIISSDIDLSKYNQVSMWVKPKGYNIPVTLYTMLEGVQTTIGSIAVTNLKADVWQQVSFDLTTVSAAAMSGLYTYAYNSKSLLIDDICFTRSYYNTESWDLSAGGPSNTLPTELAYQDGVGITLKTSTTDSAVYESGAKVASIENPVTGVLSDVIIDSSSLGEQGSMMATSSATYLDGIVATNPALYSMDKNGRFLYYYDSINNGLFINDRLNNTRTKIYIGEIKYVKTSETGNRIAFVDSGSNLYLLTNPSFINTENITTHAIIITTGAISYLNFKNDNLYYNCDNELYIATSKFEYSSEKIADCHLSEDITIVDPPDASQILGSNLYRYYYFGDYIRSGSYYYFRVWRHDNFYGGSDVVTANINITSTEYAERNHRILRVNRSGSMVTVFKNYSTNLFIIDNANTSQATVSLVPGLYYSNNVRFVGEHLEYDNYNNPCVLYPISYIFDSSLDVNEIEDAYVFIENYSTIFILKKTYTTDREQLAQYSTQANILNKPTSSAVVIKAKFSSQPNQVIAQMENGDIYSIDTRTKTSRLVISKMVLHDVLRNGRLLLSDISDTKRFLIYDPTTNSKEVFRLDNRNTSSSFTIQLNEETKTVYYLNNENKMQVLPLAGAETKDKYALMLNNDNKWWVYQNNAWKTIYTGADNPSADIMDSMGMTAAEVNAITEKEFQKLPENAKPDTLRIAVYFNSNSPYATPVLKSISVSTKDAEADLDGRTAYGTRIKEYNKADFRNVSAIHVTENKDSTDEILYFLVVDGTPYSIRNGEVCDIDKSATQLFGYVKDNYLDIMSYGMNAKELADFPAASLKEILITDNTTDKFGIVAVIKTLNKDTKDVKLDYVLESLQKRFDDSVTTVKILLTDDTLIQYTSGEVTKEEIEKFADWIMDRKYNRGPVFFTFHVGNQYKIINYYMIKMFSVE